MRTTAIPAPARVVVVGAGFGGFAAVRRLERLLRPSVAEVTLVSPTDHLLYTPLLPEVAGGVLDPRPVAVPLAGLVRSRRVPGRAVAVDVAARAVDVETADGPVRLPYDRLLLAPGSTSRTPPVPGLAEHAVGFKTTVEAAWLRDQVLARLEIAAATADPALRRAHATFVIVGAGFAGTELTAYLQRLAERLVRRSRWAASEGLRPHFVLVDAAPRVLGELEPALGEHAERVLRGRGVDVRLGTTLKGVGPHGVVLADGEVVPARTVVWCAGVTPSPLAATLGVELDRGRLPVDAYLAVRRVPGVFAVGDVAATPDLTRPGRTTAPTAQHAQRQGRTAASNLAASLGVGWCRQYRHHDLGLAADLGGRDGVAKPLGLPVRGLIARAAARGYHLSAMPANRLRVATGWALASTGGPQLVRLGLTHDEDAVLAATGPATAGASPAGAPTPRSASR